MSDPEPFYLPPRVADWLGKVVIVEEKGITAERSLIESFAVAVEDANPLYWGGVIAPPGMLSAWTRPHVWSPAGAPRQRPLELHFRLKEAFGLPKAVVIETDAVYYEPVRPGDRVRAEQVLDQVGPMVETRLGTGRKWTISMRYARHDGALQGVETLRFFAYGSQTASLLEGEVDGAERRRVGGAGAAFSQPSDQGRHHPPPGPTGRSPTQGGRCPAGSADYCAGTTIPALTVEMTATRIIMGAAASRDWQRQHHDTNYARESGLPDIILNAPSQSGWLNRYVTDWAGPGSRLGRLRFRMAKPIAAGTTVTFLGSVEAVGSRGGCRWLQVKLAIASDGQIMTDAAALLATPDSVQPWQSGPGAWDIPDWDLA